MHTLRAAFPAALNAALPQLQPAQLNPAQLKQPTTHTQYGAPPSTKLSASATWPQHHAVLRQNILWFWQSTCKSKLNTIGTEDSGACCCPYQQIPLGARHDVQAVAACMNTSSRHTEVDMPAASPAEPHDPKHLQLLLLAMQPRALHAVAVAATARSRK
jgi:hypothetical protein